LLKRYLNFTFLRGIEAYPMMRYLAWLQQIVGSAGMILFPLLWPEQIALLKTSPYFAYRSADGNLHGNWAVVLFFLSAGVVLVGNQMEKAAVTKDDTSIGERKKLLTSYGKTLSDAIKSAHVAHLLSAEQLRNAQKDVLKSITSIVYLYYEEPKGLEINACCMLAYKPCEAPPEVLARVKCLEGGRTADKYGYILDLALWAEPGKPEHLALPVEHSDDNAGDLKHLPGAPAAFIFRKPQIVRVAKIAKHFERPSGLGCNLDGVARKAQLELFQNPQYKSFVSIPLGPVNGTDTLIGVLNIQSNKDHILGRNSEQAAPVMSLLEPFREALGQLIAATTQQEAASKKVQV
jgi:hypothetical protein